MNQPVGVTHLKKNPLLKLYLNLKLAYHVSFKLVMDHYAQLWYNSILPSLLNIKPKPYYEGRLIKVAHFYFD